MNRSNVISQFAVLGNVCLYGAPLALSSTHIETIGPYQPGKKVRLCVLEPDFVITLFPHRASKLTRHHNMKCVAGCSKKDPPELDRLLLGMLAMLFV